MSFNVVSSEVCAYNQNPSNTLYGCGCLSHNNVTKQDDVNEHLEFEGATKKVVFGIIGPENGNVYGVYFVMVVAYLGLGHKRL